MSEQTPSATATVCEVSKATSTQLSGHDIPQLGRWPHEPGVALLDLVNIHTTPAHTTIRSVIDTAHADGCHAIRTTAIDADTLAALRAHGFTTLDRLAVFELDLTPPLFFDDDASHPSSWWTHPSRNTPHQMTHMRRWHHTKVVALDTASFGPMWGNDRKALKRAQSATPVSRSRVVSAGRTITGFCITGIHGANAYIQRIAVHPDYRRVGLGRQLLGDAANWAHDRGCRRVFLNASLGNPIAMLVYAELGFTQLNAELYIAECRIVQ